MPVINGVYLKDFPALPSSVADANIIPIAISGNQIAYRTTVAGIVTDARVTSKLLTGLSVTGSTISATDTILQAFGKVQNQLNGKVTSVGLTMPAAFNVANSPITSAGTLAVTAAGVASQYIRGDGALADFPNTGGGGSSVSYYLNGSINQGTFVGNTYYEMNKTPVIGTGTDFSIATDGYIAQFITDANDPASLLIPGGNWNVEMYFSASSSGGTPSFYVEVYKYDGSTFTLLGSSSATPEGITNGTAIDIYYTSVGIPETVLTITDRLAIRVYVTHSGRTITLHTEDNHLSEIVTTFSNGLTALNGLTKQTQYFATGTTGTDFNISSSVDTHTFNIPSASATARGLITTGTQTIAGDKTFTSISANPTVIIKNTGIGRKFEVHNSGGSPVFHVDGLGATFITDNLSISSGTFDMGQTMLATGASYFQSSLSVTRFLSTQTYNIAFRTGATQVTATPNWYAGNFTGNNDFEITNYAAGANQTSLKINSTTNLVTLLAGISATTANFTGQLTLGSTITNGTYTYTLPSATGTLALTSDIHSAVTLSAIGSTPNANAATLTGQVLNLEPASASFGGVVTTGTQTFAGDKTLTGSLYGIGLSMTGTVGDIIGSVATTGKAIRGTATTGFGVYASATTGTAIYGESTGTGGAALSGTSGNGIGGYFLNNATGFATLYVTNNGSGNLASFSNSAGTKFTINNAGNLGNGTYTYTLPSATGTLALTSALSSYLPLSGGTLTGALSGTSATFSGAVDIGTSSNALNQQLNVYGNTIRIGVQSVNNTNSGVFFKVMNGATQTGNATLRVDNAGKFSLFNGTTGENENFTIASTGAATFSGAIQMTGGAFPTTGAGLEILYYGGASYLQSYSRTSSAYLPIVIAASNFNVTEAGIVTAPSQVGFKAYISGANPTATKGLNNTIPYNSTVYNYGSGFNTGTYIFTAPKAGRYLFTANVNSYNNDSVATYLIRFFKNSALYTNGLYIVLPIGNTGDIVNSVSQIIDLALNDTVYMVLNNSGTGSYSYSAGLSYNSFSGQLLS